MSQDAIDAAALEQELRASLRGEVAFDDGARALYATDGSNYRQIPVGVVLPRDAEDVEAAVAACRRHGAPVLPRGCGTSLGGQCCNAAVVIDFSKYMNRILAIDPEQRVARVQPGVILDHLRRKAEQHGLTFAPDPATHDHNNVGGMLGNNSCGVHSVMGGRSADNVIELEILTYDGLRMRVGATSEEELTHIANSGDPRSGIYRRLRALRDRNADLIRTRYPDIPRRVSGYNLDDLLPEQGFHVARALVGSEGTLVTILEAAVRLVESPPERVLLVLGYPDVYAAGTHVPQVMAGGPVGVEGLDCGLIRDMARSGLYESDLSRLPEGRGWLMAEFGGATRDEARRRAEEVMDKLRRRSDRPAMELYTEPDQQERVWNIRESGLGATAHVPGKNLTWPGWEDSAVPPERVGEYLPKLRGLFDKYGYEADLYGHFGQGCIHCRIDFDLLSAGGIARYRAFVEEAAELVRSLDGSFSGEHGDGQARAELLPKMYGPELIAAFREFKSIWDPAWKMNPGKVIDPYPMDENLRLGTDYAPRPGRTIFRYPDDSGDFSRALLRCVGVGKCRREEGGTMCPSYMVTRQEQHSTRGRAHLLFEMLRGGPLKRKWRDPAVRDALELCLACKGCKGECPVNVDMATYKAEFMFHHYKGRLRPPAAYAFGHVDRWARLAARAPKLVNRLSHAPGLAWLAKRAIGVHPVREIPHFAEQTFQQWFAERSPINPDGPPVVLWPDTFNNHIHPETARSAVEVLEHAGFNVRVPHQDVCCGRPLYEWGMLPRAKRLLRRNLRVLDREIHDGIPVVGLEPACVSVFRDELQEIYPNDQQARRLGSQTFLLGEFLQRHLPELKLNRLEGGALLHGHCNQKALMSMAPDRNLLERTGLEVETPDTGCCGMAGSFGFLKEKYDVSVACGERVLLPAVRNSGEGMRIVADGYSCREQIKQQTGRRAMHLAEVLREALAAR